VLIPKASDLLHAQPFTFNVVHHSMIFKKIIQILIFSICVNTYCQTELELFFLKLKFHNLDEADKKSLIKNKKVFKIDDNLYVNKLDIPDKKRNKFHSEFEIIEFTPKSGFLSFNENYIYADGGYHYDICYWNKSNGEKLIAVRSFEFATESYDDLEFYIFKGNKLTEIANIDVLPKLTFKDLIDIDSINNDGLDKNELLKIFDLVSELEFKLPKKGKNIIAQSFHKDYDLKGNQYEILEKFRKYFIKEVVLTWNDGKFEHKK